MGDVRLASEPLTIFFAYFFSACSRHTLLEYEESRLNMLTAISTTLSHTKSGSPCCDTAAVVSAAAAFGLLLLVMSISGGLNGLQVRWVGSARLYV